MDYKYLAKLMRELTLEGLIGPLEVEQSHIKPILYCNSSYEEDKKKMNDVLKQEYSEVFDKERKARVEVSYYKYGPARDNFASGRVDAIKTAELCLDAFKKDKNTEHLVDAANYLMFRFKYPMPGEYFKPTDSNGSVGTVGTPINMEQEG